MTSIEKQLETSLGRTYTIERELGGGGMARVFVAEDRGLGRRVVVKLLPPDSIAAVDTGRFKREISLAAKLQHPHIVPLLAAGESEGLLFYTMPFVEGETLRARLLRTGELPIAEAVSLLRDVAKALAYAHAHRVVHRDVKPENILISRDAAVVTDFGVAKALEVSAEVDDTGSSGLTSRGVALGTPSYMAPEQAAADPAVDHRADIYAWGVVAYECLTGSTPFSGRGAQAVLAAQVSEMPERIERRRRNVPGPLADLVMCCLEKRPADRPQSADEIIRVLDGSSTALRAVTPNSSARTAHLAWLPWGLVALFALATLTLGWQLTRARPNTPPRLASSILPPPGIEIIVRSGFALSPDGTRLAYIGRDSSGVAMLRVRALDSGDDAPVPGTVDAVFPFWSPESESIGYVADGELRTTDLGGEGRRTLCPLADIQAQGSWSESGAIIFAGVGNVISRTMGDGGACGRLTTLAPGETKHHAPAFLPGGKHFLFWETATSSVYIADAATGSHRLLRADAQNPAFMPPHWLVFRDGRGAPLLAQRLDMSSLTTVGEPIRLLDAIARPNGYGAYAIHSSGVLVAMLPADGRELLLRVDREGRLDTISRGALRGWTHALSRSGTRIVTGGWGLWVNDPDRQVVTPIVAPAPGRRTIQWPEWSPGDSLVAYAVGVSENAVYQYRFRDATTEKLFDSGSRRVGALDWTPDGRSIVFVRGAADSAGNAELWLHSLTERTSRALFSAGDLSSPKISPDGRWIAYVSDEPGVRQVYVRPFPGPGAPERVSARGGGQPYWSGDGRTLFFVTPNERIMEVSFEGGASAKLGAPRLAVGGTARASGLWGVSADGQRFIRTDPNDETGFSLIYDWRSKLTERQTRR